MCLLCRAVFDTTMSVDDAVLNMSKHLIGPHGFESYRRLYVMFRTLCVSQIIRGCFYGPIPEGYLIDFSEQHFIRPEKLTLFIEVFLKFPNGCQNFFLLHLMPPYFDYMRRLHHVAMKVGYLGYPATPQLLIVPHYRFINIPHRRIWYYVILLFKAGLCFDVVVKVLTYGVVDPLIDSMTRAPPNFVNLSVLSKLETERRKQLLQEESKLSNTILFLKEQFKSCLAEKVADEVKLLESWDLNVSALGLVKKRQ